MEVENQTLKAKRHELNQTLSDDQASLLELTRLISDLERQIDLSKLESSQAATSRRENEERLATLSGKLAQIESNIEDKQAELSQIAAKLSDNEQSISALEAELTRLLR